MSELDKYKKTEKAPEMISRDQFKEEMEKLFLERERERLLKIAAAQTAAPVGWGDHAPVKPAAQEPADRRFTRRERREMAKKKLEDYKEKGSRLRRSEKKNIENLEFDNTNRTRFIIIVLAVIGLIFIGSIRQYLPNQAMYSIIILMGMMLFFPCGIIAGWMFLDPVMRCKILRKTSKRNYGIVGFVGKGMKAVLKIKNFDDGLIWRDKACWVITKDKIIQITKDGNALTSTERTIDADSIITLVDTVPMIFVDLDSMEPLMLHTKGREPVYPLEIGATMKAWEDNQRAKMMALRKTQDILLYIAIICAAGAIVVGFLNLQKIEAMGKDMVILKTMLANVTSTIR